MRGEILLPAVLFFLLAAYRCFLWIQDFKIPPAENGMEEGVCQTKGGRENQSDRAWVWKNGAGTMGVLAAGIGRANTGMLCAQIALDTILDRFEPYGTLHDPVYFFKTAFYEANRNIRSTIGERSGGACLGAVFLNETSLYYAVAGDVRIALMRGQELIPLSRGQTIDVLAAQAYEDGRISRQEAIWSMEEKRIWNYLGRDGFHEIEVSRQPVRLKKGDKAVLVSKGIFEELSWREIEDILIEKLPPGKLAERIVAKADQKNSLRKDNGSVIVIQRRSP